MGHIAWACAHIQTHIIFSVWMKIYPKLENVVYLSILMISNPHIFSVSVNPMFIWITFHKSNLTRSFFRYIYLFMTSFLFVVHIPPTSYENVSGYRNHIILYSYCSCVFFPLFSVVYSNWFVSFSCFLLLKHDRSLQKNKQFSFGCIFFISFHLILSSSFLVALTFRYTCRYRKKNEEKEQYIV